ncbi:MAG: nicotinate-nucleotide adenylyltransferase [Clostridiales bacterium]|jgi:nicotinate-nucleotide adenylyltransferase|nr:nicotinate-nucleotide adenylyltransferase [Eubacteriales bacterium]MDH7565557.1 nicotinate-nucleotide adenylyltransferase [Clostridiales bacterium]
MQDKNLRIGILGGTFDPVHYGHLIIAETIREKFNLDKVLFVPSGHPPHKAGLNVTEARHRFNMVRAAILSNPCFEISDIEMKKAGYGYTVDTMTQLREKYRSGTDLYFILGADVVRDLLKWKDCEKLFSLCEFIIALRPGYMIDKLREEIECLKQGHGARINITDTPVIGISSTEIREKAANGGSIKYLVPEAVEQYIWENNLYNAP